MDVDLKKLIDDLLAWLLQPNETHGIGDAFLREFTTALADEAGRQGIRLDRVPTSFEAEHVRVERERYYVDITIFFEKERVMFAIENKTGEALLEHKRQVEQYEETIREKDGDVYDVIQSVLLTTSPTPDVPDRSFIHMSWTRIRDIVRSIRQREGFDFDDGERVRAFLGHYLEIVERFAVQPEVDRDYFTTLLDDHRPLLNRLSEESEKRADGVVGHLPGDLGSYTETINRLVSDFRQQPEQLRSAVETFLRGKGFQTRKNTPPGGRWFFLYFWNASTEDTRKSANTSFPGWSLTLGHREVSVSLEFRLSKESRPGIDRITKFMKENPIDASPEGADKYPMRIRWGSYFIVYDHALMTDQELSATPVSKTAEVTLRRMAAFLEQDFTRIETYLRCLAFDPALPA